MLYITQVYMRNQKKLVGVIFGIVLLGTLIFSSYSVQAGFGISPPWFKNNYLSPGAHYEQDIFLVQGKPETDVRITIEVQSAEAIEDWITFKPGKDFIIPAGQQQFPVRVIADVPKDAGYATYTGTIRFVAGSTGGEGAVVIQLGALAVINLTVTSEEVSDFDVKRVNVQNLEKGWPLSVSVQLENLGNVKVRPTRIALTLYDKLHDKELGSGEAQTTDWVDPFQRGSITASMPTDLEIGDYWADYEIYKGDEIVAQDRQRFKVVKKGDINQWLRLFGMSIAWWGTIIISIMAFGVVIKFNILGKLLGKLGIEVKRKK